MSTMICMYIHALSPLSSYWLKQLLHVNGQSMLWLYCHLLRLISLTIKSRAEEKMHLRLKIQKYNKFPQQWCSQMFLKCIWLEFMGFAKNNENNRRLHLCILIGQLHYTENSAFYDWLHKNIQRNGWIWKAQWERNNNKGFEVSRFKSRCLAPATTGLFIQETRHKLSVYILLPLPLQPRCTYGKLSVHSKKLSMNTTFS